MADYPIGVSRSLGVWNFNNSHVERSMDNASYDAAHPDDTMLLAGPARRQIARADTASTRTLFGLGNFISFSMSSQAPIQPMMMIGSARGYFLRGKSQSGWTIERVLLNGKNLLRALYHAAVEAGINADQFDDPATYDNAPQSNWFVNLDSELFYIPVGLGVIMRAKARTLVGGCYLELSLPSSWGVRIGAGQASIMESIQGVCDRILPFYASDAMDTPRVGRNLMDAVLGLAPNTSPEASYTRVGQSGTGGLNDGRLPGL